MVHLVATANFPYNGHKLREGDAFTACERDAHILKLLEKAVDAQPTRYRTKVIQPPVLDESQNAASPSEPRKRRQYRRRDLEAES